VIGAKHIVLPVVLWVAGLTTACGDAQRPAAEGVTITSLPLKRGFYVASDTPCSEASNATLLLVGKNGINGSRDYCTFKKIEQMGADRYKVTTECRSGGEAWGRAEEIDTYVAVYTIANDTSFESKSETGWEHSARYCEQSSLPTDWRENDISDLIR
jgi:hypothetical protein